MAIPNNIPDVKAEMLIRKPVEEVFEAFVDPEITTKFWFTKSSGRLEAGKRVRWDWEMYDVFTEVDVKEVEKNKRILIEWSPTGYTTVEWLFQPKAAGTLVTIINSGYKGAAEDITATAIDSMGGFTMVLCGLKVLLEHNIDLNIIADKAPDANVKR